MAIVGQVNQYKYFYGAGCEPNRVINFVRNNPDEPIKAEVYAIVEGNPKQISEVLPNQINVEMMSTTDKVNALKAARMKLPYNREADKKMHELSPAKQDEIIKGLEPKGPWRVEITNGIGTDPKFEKVVYLSIFNPK